MNERDRMREEEMQGTGWGKYHWKLNKLMQLHCNLVVFMFSSIHFVFKSLSLSLSLSLYLSLSGHVMKRRDVVYSRFYSGHVPKMKSFIYFSWIIPLV